MNVVFRKATIDDVEGIIKLCDKIFEEKTDIAEGRRLFQLTDNSPNDIYIVGVIDDEIIAHAKVTIIRTMYDSMGNYAMINHVAVKEELRRHKIATMMLDYIADISKKCECKTMCLWSKNFREAAHKCYKNYGFELLEAGFFEKRI